MFDQSSFECKLEWGPKGARDAAERGEIVIIVDVLSFSSTVVTAMEYGAVIYPYPPPLNEKAVSYAEELQARMVWSRAEAAVNGGHSLSPLTFTVADHGEKFVFCSLNGAACTASAGKAAAVLVGSLLNAASVARVAEQLSRQINVPVTVIPCGEKWSDASDTENRLRPGIEDYLGAGLILSKLTGNKSPEAEVCAGAYEHNNSKITDLIWDCASGRELRIRGYERDVACCTQIDVSQAVPILRGDHFQNAIKGDFNN